MRRCLKNSECIAARWAKQWTFPNSNTTWRSILIVRKLGRLAIRQKTRGEWLSPSTKHNAHVIVNSTQCTVLPLLSRRPWREASFTPMPRWSLTDLKAPTNNSSWRKAAPSTTGNGSPARSRKHVPWSTKLSDANPAPNAEVPLLVLSCDLTSLPHFSKMCYIFIPYLSHTTVVWPINI